MWFMIWWLDSYLGCLYTRYIIMSLISLDLHSLFQLFVDFRESLYHQISNRRSVLKSSLDSILLLKSLQIQTHTDISYNPLPVFLICESLWMKASDK